MGENMTNHLVFEVAKVLACPQMQEDLWHDKDWPVLVILL